MLGKNEKTEPLGFWPGWFRNIIEKHGEVYSKKVHSQNKKGDVIVGWRRGSDNPAMWKSGESMLILGDEEPSSEDWEAAGVSWRTGETKKLWLSYLTFKNWTVYAEGKRGRFRPFGVLVMKNG